MNLEEYREVLLRRIRFWNTVIDEPSGTETQKKELKAIIDAVTSVYYDLKDVTAVSKQ